MSDGKQINDYAATVLIPKTDFPQQAKLAHNEVETIKRWEKINLAEKILKKNEGKPKYILHDGPPYANGDIHIGHALNKILKDVIVRFKSMQGFYSPYIPGWDCHGLPIEQKVTSKLGKKAHTMPPEEIRKLCQEYAMKFVNIQREQFKRLLIGGSWDKPYLTMNSEYEVGILKAFKALVENEYIYRGKKPVYWCSNCLTALAEAEVEYEDHKSPSIYVKFPFVNPESNQITNKLKNPSIVIWTTTPWTLPANLAVALDPDYDYVAIEINDETYIVAKYLLTGFLEASKFPQTPNIISEFKGKQIEGLKLKHPLLQKESVVIVADFVTLEQGTGCVHIAPGHGMEDFLVCQKYGIETFVPVDDEGCFTDDFPTLKGENVWKANPKIIEILKEKNILISSSTISHTYPHCWRCHNPIIFRATEQWFMSVDKNNLRQHILEAIEKSVEWIPKWGKDRIYNMVMQRPDWCLSRQRSWGVPIPAVVCESCGKSHLDLRVFDKFIEKVATEGTNTWYTTSVEEFIPANFKCDKCGGAKFRKEKNILDVWFDSGASHIAVLESDSKLTWPCNIYVEGSDQHRGWFQSSILIAMGAKSAPPYKQVLTHGFILDEKGEAMSKSKGNVISPLEVIKELGAGVLRLWVISEDYRGDIKVSKEILKRNAEAYRKIRNTLRFLLANVQDFNIEKDAVPYQEMEEIDQYILHVLNELIKKVTDAYESFELHRIYHSIHSFCVVDMSSFYLDILKDRLYCSAANDRIRRSAQTVIYHIASCLGRLIAPVLPHTTDEFWSYFNPKSESIHLESFPVFVSEWERNDLADIWSEILKVRDEVLTALETVRKDRIIGHSLDADITLITNDDNLFQLLNKYKKQWESIFIVSNVNIQKEQITDNSVSEKNGNLLVLAKSSNDEKCPRCWRHKPEVKKDEISLCNRCADVIRRLYNVE